jgi:hypothetical protein
VIEPNPHFGDTFRTWRRTASAVLACAAWWGAFGCGRTDLDSLDISAGPATGGSPGAGSSSLVGAGGAVALGGRGGLGGAGKAPGVATAGKAGLAAAGDSGSSAVGAGTGAGGASAEAGEAGLGEAGAGGAGGEVGAPCGPDECAPWVQVGGDLPPAYSYVVAAAASEVGTVYTGSDSYGSVYKTTTSGASWSAASTGIEDAGVRALAVDPFDADYVWAGNLKGLYRSSNAGASWSKLDVDSSFPWVEWITTDPVVKGRVYVLLNTELQVNPTSSAAYVSDDRGLSWRRLGAPANVHGHTLDVDTSDATHLFLGTYTGVFESHDGGASFQAVAGPPGKRIYQVIYEPTSKVLCAVAENGIAQSLDGGATWQTQQNVTAFLMTLAPGPTFYVDGNWGVFRSSDCSNWTLVDHHRGYHAVVDGAGAVYAATTAADGFQGVRRSPDGVAPFVNVNSGITTADVSDLALDGSVTDGLFVSVRYTGIYHSVDGAASYSSATGDLGYVGTTAFPDALLSTGSTLFAFNRAFFTGRLFHSDDKGSTWTTTLLSLPNNSYAGVRSVLPSPTFATDNVVYIGTRAVNAAAISFEQSLDRGQTFTPRGNGDFATLSMIWDKTHDGWIWALGATTPDDLQSERLYLSKDTGLTWSEATQPPPGAYYGQVEAALTPNGEVLYVTVGGQGVARSDDAGSTWQVTGAPPGDVLHRLVVDPTDSRTLYAVTGPNGVEGSPGVHGVFKSRDGGVSWSRADRGLPPDMITSLLIEPNNPQIVYAGVRHGGLYKTTTGGE